MNQAWWRIMCGGWRARERMLKCRCDPLVVALGVCLCLCRWSGGRSCGSLRPRYRRTHRSLLGGRASFEQKTDRKRSSAHGFSAPVNGDQAGLEPWTRRHIESDFLFLPLQHGFTHGRSTRARSARITARASLKHHPPWTRDPTAPMQTKASVRLHSPPPWPTAAPPSAMNI